MPIVILEELRKLNAQLHDVDVRLANAKRENRANGMGGCEWQRASMSELYAERRVILANVRELCTRYGVVMP